MEILSRSHLLPVKSKANTPGRLRQEWFAGMLLPCFFLGWICLMTLESNLAAAQKPGLSEYDIKAGFLYNFIKYVEWPPKVLPGPQSAIVLGTLGRDAFDLLSRSIGGQTLNGRPLQVKNVASSDDFKTCHVLFIPFSEKRRLPQVLESLKSSNVLTVGETDDFSKLGGIINFIKEENKIRFQINIDAAKRAELKIDSTLLNLARIVRDDQK
jgi:hypothetical protein